MGELEGDVWGTEMRWATKEPEGGVGRSKVELAEPEDEEETETERALPREEEIGIGSEC
jgi:hypothetical protein